MGWNPKLFVMGLTKAAVLAAMTAAAALSTQPAPTAQAATLAAHNAEIPSSRCDALSLRIAAIEGAEKLSREFRVGISDRLKAVRQAPPNGRAKAIDDLNKYKTASLKGMRGVIDQALGILNDADKFAKEKPGSFSSGLSDGIQDGKVLAEQAITHIDEAIGRVPRTLDQIPIENLWGSKNSPRTAGVSIADLWNGYDPNTDDTTIVLQVVGDHLKLIMPTLDGIKDSVQLHCSGGMKKTEAALGAEEELLNEPG